MEVYQKVRQYLEVNGYPQGVVAQRAGIADGAFAAMMNGRRKMYADDLRAICLALRVKPEVFIDVSTKHS